MRDMLQRPPTNGVLAGKLNCDFPQNCGSRPDFVPGFRGESQSRR
jgi:hypothetical protein